MDDYELDEDELEDIYEENPRSIELDKIIKMATIDKRRKVKIDLELKDANEDVIPVSDITTQLVQYIIEENKKEESYIINQLTPLMTKIMISGLDKIMGTTTATFLLSNHISREAILNMMTISFLLLKFMQDHELKIHTYEEALDDEEIERLIKQTQISDIIMVASMAGVSPRVLFEELFKLGNITENEYNYLLELLDDE